jgi:hypothetical protein
MFNTLVIACVALSSAAEDEKPEISPAEECDRAKK